MQALLVLYMSQYLLLPGQIEHVAGFSLCRAAIEHLYGTLSAPALASAIQGLYAGGFYLTPIAGGFLADRVLGRTRTIILGAVLMAVGHFMMALPATFLPALLCILLGAGCFNSNLATQVGELYGPADLRRADAFQLYQLGVTVAVIFSPLICGTLGQNVAWRWGFCAAGGGMLLGLAAYLAGLPSLPAAGARRTRATAPPPRLTSAELKTELVLIALLPALMLAMLGNQEIFNAYIVWGDASYNLVFLGHVMPVTWLISLDAFSGAAISLLTILFWRAYDRRFGPLNEITRAAIGAAILAASPLILAAASAHATASHQRVGLAWGVAFHLLNSIGFVNLYPVGLALFSRAAPPALAGVMMGAFKLHLFAANVLVGWLGGLLTTMPGAQFWLLHAGLCAAGAALLLVFRLLFASRLAPARFQAVGAVS
jgi:POT family proton-dependent oligopeptide transporter